MVEKLDYPNHFKVSDIHEELVVLDQALFCFRWAVESGNAPHTTGLSLRNLP